MSTDREKELAKMYQLWAKQHIEAASKVPQGCWTEGLHRGAALGYQLAADVLRNPEPYLERARLCRLVTEGSAV